MDGQTHEKNRPGIYCRGSSAHAPTITQILGNHMSINCLDSPVYSIILIHVSAYSEAAPWLLNHCMAFCALITALPYIFNFKAVIKSFNASLNVELLRLPQKTCAGYMCKEELKIINDAHKAHVLCENASKGKGIFLQTDGTTKHQWKLGGAIVNGLVLGVNELPNKKVTTAVECSLMGTSEQGDRYHRIDTFSIIWFILSPPPTQAATLSTTTTNNNNNNN